MARFQGDDTGGQAGANGGQGAHVMQTEGQAMDLPEGVSVADVDILRDGQDLILQASDGSETVIEGYFSVVEPPTLTAADGSVLTPSLVESFVQEAGPAQYAQSTVMSDVSPVGEVSEVTGTATVTHPDGTTEPVVMGTDIYQGDIIETGGSGAVNITFIDESTFAVSESAKLAIDEYVFDPASNSGASDFSILRGVFVYTSGLIGREDPDDVEIETPVGSIGIRGTTIAGTIDPEGESQITVVEGAIVIKNGAGEQTLSGQYETVTITGGYEGQIENMGQLEESQVAEQYNVLRTVDPDFFTGLEGSDADTADEVMDPTLEDGEAAEEGDPEMMVPGDEPLPVDESMLMEGEMPLLQDEASLMEGDMLRMHGDLSLMEGDILMMDDPMLGPDMLMMEPTAEFEQQIIMDMMNTANFDGSDPFFTGNTFFTDGPAGDMGDYFYFDPYATDFGGDTLLPPPPPPSGSDPYADPYANSTGGNTAPPPPLDLVFMGGDVDEDAPAGFIIGEAFTTVNFPDVTFSLIGVPLSSGGNPLVAIVNSGPAHVRFVLTPAGAAEVALYGTGFMINFDVRASLPDGRHTISHFNSIVLDDPLAPGTVDLQALSGADGFTITGASGERLGQVVTAWGDSDGDGMDDFLLTNDKATGGQVFVYDGARSAVGALPGNPTFDASVSGAGDFDGDGDLDFVAGTPDSDFLATNAGGGVVASVVMDNMVAGQLFGESVAGIGDINGDGLNDTLFGAPGSTGNFGASYVIFGGSTGVVDAAALGGNGFKVNGTTTSGYLGMKVSGAGDFDGDGYADFAMSEAGLNRIHIAFGSSTISSVALGVGTLRINGIATDPASHKIPITQAGDVNGDGISDIMLASTGKNVDGDAALEGEVYVIYGKTSYGANQSMDVNTMAAADGFKISITDPESIFGGGGAAGDFNGDGYDDVMVMLRTGDMADIYVVYGKQSMGLSVTDAMLDNTNVAFHMVYDIGNTGSFHFSLSGVGDRNGDGFDDVAIGMSDANGGNGEVTVVYGRNDSALGANGQQVHIAGQTTGLPDVVANANNQSLVGDNGSNVLNSAGYAGVSFSGGAGSDTIEIGNGSNRTIDGGTGLDTLIMMGGLGVLNFTNVGSEALSGIEKFQMTSSAQILRLGLDDIFRLFQESQDSVSGKTVLRVQDVSGGATTLDIDDNGGATGTFASVAAGLGFTAAGTVNDGGTTYNAWNFGSGYQLLIDQNVDNVIVT